MDEKEILGVVLEELRRQNAMLLKTLEQLTEQNRQKDERIEELSQMLLNLQRARFGQRSEKSVYVLDDSSVKQLSLFDAQTSSVSGNTVPDESGSSNAEESVLTDEETKAEAVEIPNPEEIVVAAHTRKKKRTLEELCAALPAEECVTDLPEEERFNLRGTPLVCIGREYIRTELVMERAKVKVVKHYRKVYADRETELLTGESEIFKPELSAPLLPHSYVSASVAADILTKKYADGLPLYRQEQAWKRMGIPLRRGTMANWMIRISEVYLQPFYQRLHEELLKQAVIHADETVVQVLKEEGRSPTAESRMWVFTSGKQADAQIRCFLYSETRRGDCAEAFLNGYSGILVTDGYSGYNKVTGVTHAGCWAHMRRKWHEAMPKGESGQKGLAAQGYRFCSRLFAVERELEGLSPEERIASRQQKSAPILEAYWSWLDTLGPTSGKLKDAVTYARNQKSSLCTFLTHGEVEISNNQVENAIRPFVVGRKGWLFSDTPEGAQASAVIYSLVETAKANDLRLEDYLLHLLTVLPNRFATDTRPDISDLLPWATEMQQQFALW